jgi:hypothetical protein
MERPTSKSLSLVLGLSACSWFVPISGRAAELFSHQQLDQVLRRHVGMDSLVDYPALKSDRAGLDAYVEQIAQASPRSHPEQFPTRDHELAFWINAYNALALRVVIDHYPTGGVQEILSDWGVFNQLESPVGGVGMTLDDIEKGVLLREWKDVPEVHWALTCASMGCPRLDRKAWRAEGIHARLRQEGVAYLNSDAGVRFDTVSSTVHVTRYFEWYGDDFAGDPLTYIRPLLTDERRAKLEAVTSPTVAFMEYDWRLNDSTAAWARR